MPPLPTALVVGAAVAAAAYLAIAAAGLLTGIGDAGCDAEFSRCIRVRQQLARVALAVLAATGGVLAVRSAVQALRGRGGRRPVAVVIAVALAVLFALVDPVTHLDSRSEWLGGV